MSLRFQKRIRVFPGIYLNVGMNGVSTTIGPRGANINIGKNGTYLNTGIPGTGFSSRKKLLGDDIHNLSPPSLPLRNFPEDDRVPMNIEDNTSNIVTSEGLLELKEQLYQVKKQRELIVQDIKNINDRMTVLRKELLDKQDGFISKFFTSKDTITRIQNELEKLRDELPELAQAYSDSRAEISFNLDPFIDEQFQKLTASFRDLTQCKAIWDIISITETAANHETKSIAERIPVRFSFQSIDYINSKNDVLFMQNANGADLYIFPAFILLKNKANDEILVDMKDVSFEFFIQKFIESDESIPSDAEVVDNKWSKANKDGSPDMRFKNNIQRPIVNYCALHFQSTGGLDETYYVSNIHSGKQFSDYFTSFIKIFSGEEFSSDAPPMAEEPSPTLISKEYFDLLLMLSNEVFEMKDILEKDETTMKSFSEILKTTKIDVLMAYDLAKIFKILMGNNVERKLVEMSALFFGVCRLLGNSEVYRTMDYEKFVALHSEGALIKAAESILNIDVSMTVREGDQDPAINNSDFILPALLIHSENPLFDKYAVILCQFATIIAKADGVVSGNEEKLLKEIYEKIHNSHITSSRKPLKFLTTGRDQSLSDILEELNSLIGLASVKQEVNTLINFATVQTEREKLGLKSSQVSYHLVLTGAPGTGKTTVARIVSKIYNKLGILEKGQLVETDRSGLIAEYLGQTSAKVNKAVDSALDGVLFIDEAYALIDGGKNDYGKEAIATLLKRMEDDREKLVVMVAGYTEEMKTFIDANSGLKSRFNKYIEFPDYTPEEMVQIFVSQCKGLDYCLTDEAKIKVFDLVELAYEQRDRSFGNGRYVRNTFEKAMERQANRVAGVSPLTKEILTTIIGDDIPEK